MTTVLSCVKCAPSTFHAGARSRVLMPRDAARKQTAQALTGGRLRVLTVLLTGTPTCISVLIAPDHRGFASC